MNKTTTDTNLKKLKKNAYRVSKVRGETASRVRCPGGEIDVDSLQRVVDIARKYGKGMVNITNRQGFEIPGIDLKDVEEVNKALQLIIENRNINQEEYNGGYPASGTRNVVACPGKQLCPFANYDTKKFASIQQGSLHQLRAVRQVLQKEISRSSKGCKWQNRA